MGRGPLHPGAGPGGRPRRSTSYYRQQQPAEAPGIMADLRDPMPFSSCRSARLDRTASRGTAERAREPRHRPGCDEVTFVPACRPAPRPRLPAPTTSSPTTVPQPSATRSPAGGIHLPHGKRPRVAHHRPQGRLKDVDRWRAPTLFEAASYWFPRRAAVKRPAHHPGRPRHAAAE